MPRDRQVIGPAGPTSIDIIETLTLHWKYETKDHIIRCDNKAKETGWGTWYTKNKDGKCISWHTGQAPSYIMPTEEPERWYKEYWQQSFNTEKDVS